MESLDDLTSPGGPPSGITLVPGPVRMVRIAGFLPQGERDALYETACANQAAFHGPGGPGSDPGGTSFLSLDAPGSDAAEVEPVRKASKCLSDRILDLLPTLFTTLEIEPFAVPEIPLTFINGLNGHTGSPHADSLDGRFRISLLYYFHKVPKVFRGGDLEFFPTDAESPDGHSHEVFARVDQEDNTLLAFPSQTFHGVTDVRCDSEDFADGRFVAVGFLGPQ